MAKAGHIRCFGKIPALNSNYAELSVWSIPKFEIRNPKSEIPPGYLAKKALIIWPNFAI
jgi:hypothetical protein